MKDIDAQRILEAYEAVDPETGSRMSPKAHGIDEADDQPYDGMDDIHQDFERRELIGKVDVRIREIYNGQYKSLDEWLYKYLSELKADAEADGKDAEAILKNWIDGWIEQALSPGEDHFMDV